MTGVQEKVGREPITHTNMAIESPIDLVLNDQHPGMTVAPGRWSRRGARFVYLVSFLVVVALFLDGWSYYSTPFAERPRHEEYRTLRPAGARGLVYGITGTAMMLLMLAYSLRKRLKFMRRWLKLPLWLDLHIYLGVFGPLFILLHTSFKISGLVAIAFWSMVAVALSGFVGRYLYRLIPRSIHGDELTLRELNQMRDGIEAQLQEDMGLPAETVTRLRHDVAFPASVTGLWGTMRALIGDRFRQTRMLREIVREISREHGIPGDRIEALTALARTQWRLQSRMQTLEQVQRLFHYWHVAHKPFAVLMYLIVAVHVGVAVWTGYAAF